MYSIKCNKYYVLPNTYIGICVNVKRNLQIIFTIICMVFNIQSLCMKDKHIVRSEAKGSNSTCESYITLHFACPVLFLGFWKLDMFKLN